MEELNNIIAKHRYEFDVEMPLDGDFDRFVSKWDSVGEGVSPKRNIWRRGGVILSVAASVALMIGLGISFGYFTPQREMIRVYEEYCREVAALSAEMQMMVSVDEIEVLNNTIENIDYESIPFISLLPEEMSQKEKLRYIKEHYNQKLDGIKRFKILLTESKIEEEL